MANTILVTGGAGYIGSHACVALMEAGLDVVVLDNLCNADVEVFDRLKRITGRSPKFVHGDIRDRSTLDAIFADQVVTAVMHFAGLKAVAESATKPLEYYASNVGGTLTLLAAMEQAGVKSLVFSSSATVYGDPASVPIQEHFPLSATNPYGRSKLMVEEILADWQKANPAWSIGCLRYFNPVGAHPSGLIGENPTGTPNNLMPYMAQVAVGRQDQLYIFGDDYPTVDGTGVRDYIHVMDLVEGHVAALNFIRKQCGLFTANLGTGSGTSVLELLRAFEQASSRSIPCQVVDRRPGDVAQCWADTSLAKNTLGWSAVRSLRQMCEDSWRWQSKNPKGYS
jgi:UDP-glucose 4-epimerase